MVWMKTALCKISAQLFVVSTLSTEGCKNLSVVLISDVTFS